MRTFMLPRALVEDVTTVDGSFEDRPRSDVAKLSVCGRAFFLTTPPGQLELGEFVPVRFTSFTNRGEPLFIELDS
jgi:hypothetical protein